MADTIYKLQQRVQNYSTEAEVYQEGNNRINVDIPGVSDANAILEELGKPGSLIFVDSEGNQILDGKQVASAKAGMTEDKATGSKAYVVSLTFTEEGKQASENQFISFMITRLFLLRLSVRRSQADSARSTAWRIMKRQIILRPRSVSVPCPWSWKSCVPT